MKHRIRTMQHKLDASKPEPRSIATLGVRGAPGTLARPTIASCACAVLTLSMLTLGCGRTMGESNPRISGSTNWLKCVEVEDCVGVNHATCDEGYCLDIDGERVLAIAAAENPRESTPSTEGAISSASAPSTEDSDPTGSGAPSANPPTTEASVTAFDACTPTSSDVGEPLEFFAAPDNNYSLQTNLDVALQTVRSETNLTFDWSALTTDFSGHPLDPRSDVEVLVLTMRELTPAGMLGELNAEEPSEAQTPLFLTLYPDEGQTSIQLDRADVTGTPVDWATLKPLFDADPNSGYDPDKFTYSLMLQSSPSPGAEVRMLTFFKLDPQSTQETVTLTDTSTRLDYAVDLEANPPLELPPGDETRALAFDWSKLASYPTRAFIEHYDATLSEIETNFLNLEQLARQRWDVDVTGKT